MTHTPRFSFRCAFASLALVTGCAASSATRDDVSRVDAPSRISAADIDALPSGAVLVVHQADSSRYSFDVRAGALDLSRVTVLSARGEEIPMASWLAAVDAGERPSLAATESFELTWNQGAAAVGRSPDRISCICCETTPNDDHCWTIPCGTKCSVKD